MSACNLCARLARSSDTASLDSPSSRWESKAGSCHHPPERKASGPHQPASWLAWLSATPISMPGEASLAAAAHPASSKALYFVARGDGSSEFSDSLDAHNRAVNKYIRGR